MAPCHTLLYFILTVTTTLAAASPEKKSTFTVQVHHEMKPSPPSFQPTRTAKLSPLVAQKLEFLSHVVVVIPEQVRQLHTIRSPQFLGLKIAYRVGLLKEIDFGSNLVIGVIDTCPDRESFNDRDLGAVPPNWKDNGGGGPTTQKEVKRVGYDCDKVA
ncbi:hypothetical protein AHAS_Ahas05G0100400 [Arachis hypogaea]